MSDAKNNAGSLTHDTPFRRTIALLVAFAVVMVIGILTVLAPELANEGTADPGAETAAPQDL